MCAKHKICSLFLLLLISLNSFSQEEFVKLPKAKTQHPCYIFNENIIGSKNTLISITSSKEQIRDYVTEVYVLKGKLSRDKHDFYNLTAHGVLLVDLKKEIPSKTQAELNVFFGLHKNSDIYFNGYLIESKKYNISITGISEIEVIEPNNENRLTNKVLNIWTHPKN